MSDLVKLYGPPGTGKTRKLTELALRAAQRYGPERVAALTFTRAAAEELKLRIAQGLGIRLPNDQWGRRRALQQYMPWVGTIHALALRLAGPRRVLSARDLGQFIRAQGGQSTLDEAESPEDAEGYTWDDAGRDEVEAALAVYAMARHRMIEMAQAYAEMQWGWNGPSISPMQATHLCRAYEDYKQDLGKWDFEDMLEHGLDTELPVDVCLADEVQDNSPLLWLVLDRWSAGKLTALAGDPYQALYTWSGADPSLFIDHEGDLARLGSSHRLTAAAAARAQLVLREAGYEQGDWLGTWGGLGSGEAADGSVFWLARTGRLLQHVRRALEDEGTPYANLRGGGPLSTKESDAFRVLLRLRQRGVADVASIGHLALNNDRVSKRAANRIKDIVRQNPDEQWGIGEAETYLEVPLDHLDEGFKRADYFARVLIHHGDQAFREHPKTLVGTIHAAKGREADVVHLVDSWGTLPARALHEPEGRRAEACVAYVALTRHRAQLVLEPADEGTPYPW